MTLSRKTFTLIEMLIVIVIIGILAAALVPRLQSVQWRARDTKRKTDLKTIYNGLEIYKIDFGLYARPQNLTLTTGAYDSDAQVFSYQTQPWISGLANYLTSVPKDPINTGIQMGSRWMGSWRTGNYLYTYSDVYNGGLTYDLTAQLENRNDPDRCSAKAYRYYYTTTGLTIAWCGAYSPLIYEYSPDSNSF